MKLNIKTITLGRVDSLISGLKQSKKYNPDMTIGQGLNVNEEIARSDEQKRRKK